MNNTFQRDPKESHTPEFETRQSNAPLSENIVSALAYFFSSLVYILFVCPWGFWVASTNRLANDRKNCRLDIIKSSSRWPYLTFIKRVFFEFLIDGITFISWFLGILVALIILFYGFVKGDAAAAIGSFFGVLAITYYLPPLLALIRDMATLSLLPIYKFLSWVSKPAQYLDIDMRRKDVK